MGDMHRHIATPREIQFVLRSSILGLDVKRPAPSICLQNKSTHSTKNILEALSPASCIICTVYLSQILSVADAFTKFIALLD
jgi:hypothetical protein